MFSRINRLIILNRIYMKLPNMKVINMKVINMKVVNYHFKTVLKVLNLNK